MNILVVSQYYYPEPFRLNEICEELVKRNHNVTVLTCNPNYPDGEIYDGYQNKNSKEIINSVIVYRCKCRPRHKGAFNLALNYVDFVRNANKLILTIDEDFDCIYIYQLSPITSCMPAIKLKKERKLPIFLYCLDVWPESLRGSILGREPFFSLIGQLSKWIYCNAEKIAVSSPSFLKYLANYCDLNENVFSYLPQHARMIKITDEMSDLYMKYNQYINFIFLGNIGESQNVQCIIKAVSNIKDRSKMKLHIVGSGSYLEVCKKESKRLGTNDAVIFHGRRLQEEMPLFYRIADVCMVTLKDEGIVGYTIPAKLQEYMSAGKAVLGCINGDAANVINDAKCGINVPANNDVELSKAMEFMISNKEKLVEFGENAKKYYLENFTLDVHVNKLEKELESFSRGVSR